MYFTNKASEQSEVLISSIDFVSTLPTDKEDYFISFNIMLKHHVQERAENENLV